MDAKKRSLVPGLIIIALGIILLLHNMHIIPRLEEFIGGLFFLVVAYFCFRIFQRNARHLWALLIAIFSFLFGIALLCKTVSLFRGDLLGTAFFWCIAVAFGYVYYRNKKNWWSILPAGTCITLGTIALLDTLDITPYDFNGVVFFLGIGLTFMYLWTLANASNKLHWARFPAIGCLLMSLYIYIETVSHLSLDMIIGGILVLAGALIIARAFKRR